MSTTTTNYGLIKPDTTDPILVGQLNDNMDTIDTVLKDHSDKIDAAALGIKYKGEVNYYVGLPNNAEIGDAYTVKYAGSSGTTPDGTEYVWGTVSGTNQWINFSKDSYTKAEVDALLALKQNALSSTQLAAVNSGIDSAKVAQIETNKNNISYLENTGKKNWLKPDTISEVPTGITIRYESDDSITINGTYSGSDYAYVFLYSFSHTAMRYTLSCNVATTSNTFYFYTSDNKMSSNLTPIYTYTTSNTTRIVMRIAPNTSFSNVNVKLMIRPSVITDSTYQPYAMSNAELTAAIQALQAQLANQ